jgi:hypothetical protein
MEEERSDEFLIKMQKWGLISKDHEIRGYKVEETPKRLKPLIRKNALSPIACFSPSLAVWNNIFPSAIFASVMFNAYRSTQNIKEISKEAALKRRINVLESQCTYFAQKLTELEGHRPIALPQKIKESEMIYEEHKAELEENCYGKVVAIDNTERKIVGIGDTILEAFDDANAKTKKEKFSFKRVGYTDRL